MVIILDFNFQCLDEKVWSFEEKTLKKENGWLGWKQLISHEEFRSWAEKNEEDSLDMLATVTLHRTGERQDESVTKRFDIDDQIKSRLL